MVSVVSSSLVCVLCVILLPDVGADSCHKHLDRLGEPQSSTRCEAEYCCGECNFRYCCGYKSQRLDQDSCDRTHTPLASIFGSIFGSIFTFLSCASVILCCVCPCCICYKKCRKRRNHTVVNTIIHAPQQPPPPVTIHQPAYPGYNPVPVQPGYLGPPTMPNAPPTYMEAIDPSNYSAAFNPGLPMYPLHPPAAPQQSLEEQTQPAYNPSYVPTL